MALLDSILAGLPAKRMVLRTRPGGNSNPVDCRIEADRISYTMARSFRPRLMHLLSPVTNFAFSELHVAQVHGCPVQFSLCSRTKLCFQYPTRNRLNRARSQEFG